MKRRDFIKLSSLASTSMLIPGFLNASSQFDLNQLNVNGKRLIVLQLSGGNDGLNTVVPIDNPIYYDLRPKIAIQPTDAIRINSSIGLNPSLKYMSELLGSGDLTIINGVGYPNPNRSHFRSMDIWHTASDSNEHKSEGWLGKYLDHHCSGSCSIPLAVEIEGSLGLAMKGENQSGLAFQSIKQLNQLSKGQLNQYLSSVEVKGNSQQDFLYKTLRQTHQSTEYIFEKYGKKSVQESFPKTQLGKKLKTIAECILNDLETRIYYTSLSGFDTHAFQQAKQSRLLKQMDEALHHFVKCLKDSGEWNNTMILVFSEFGRRVKENASSGTDHGAGNNLFVLGGNLKKTGIMNEMPDLEKLQRGDVSMQIDFRQVYATILEDWMQQDAQSILGKSYDKLGF